MHIDALMSRPTVRGHEARVGIEAFGHLLCKAWNLPPIRITWGPIPTACIDASGCVTLCDLGDASIVTRDTVARYAGFVLHELLHRRFTSFNARDGRPYVDSLLNAIEDARIERQAIAEGLVGNVRGLLGTLLGGMVREALAEVQDWADPRQYPFSLAVYLRDYGTLVPVPGELMPIYTEARKRLAACRSTEDALTLARWVYSQLQNPQQQQQQQQRGQDDEQEEGEEGGKQGGQNEAEGSGGTDRQCKPENAGPAQCPADGMAARETEPQCPTTDRPHSEEWAAGCDDTDVYTVSKDAQRTMDGPIPGRLRYEVRRLFENTARDWQEAGYRSGRLHAGSLHRVAHGAGDVFSRRFEVDGIESAAVLCIDMSGSMCSGGAAGCSLLDVATRAAWALTDSLVAAGVDVAILGFTQSVYTFRKFGKFPAAQAREVLSRLKATGGTDDYRAIRQAHSMLLQHPAQRRVCFVLTDGIGNQRAAAHQVKEGEALGISTIALGIRHDVRAVYGPSAVRVDNMENLGSVAFRQIKRAA